MAKRIYLSPPHLDGRERELMLEAYDSNWITTLGPQVDAFADDLALRPHKIHDFVDYGSFYL